MARSSTTARAHCSQSAANVYLIIHRPQDFNGWAGHFGSIGPVFLGVMPPEGHRRGLVGSQRRHRPQSARLAILPVGSLLALDYNRRQRLGDWGRNGTGEPRRPWAAPVFSSARPDPCPVIATCRGTADVRPSQTSPSWRRQGVFFSPRARVGHCAPPAAAGMARAAILAQCRFSHHRVLGRQQEFDHRRRRGAFGLDRNPQSRQGQRAFAERLVSHR